MSHTLTGSRSDAPVVAALAPPYGFISYETTGTSVRMWNTGPVPLWFQTIDPCGTAVGAGHGTLLESWPERKTMATSPGGRPLVTS